MGVVFSVLVPVYNVEIYIRDSIESILNQTFRDFELILVDDGSTDRSGAICDEYAGKDNRIKVIHNSNHGLLYTRRVAFAEAVGTYCVVVDSDDKIKKNALQVLYDYFQQYNCDCIIFGYERVYKNEIIETIADREVVQITNKRDIYMRVFLNTQYNPICRKTFKRTLLDGRDYSPYYNLSLREDLLQSIEILQNAQSVTFVPDALYEYTSNPQSMTHTVNAENYKADTTIRNAVFDFLSSCGELSKDDIEKYTNYCLFLFCTEIKKTASFKCAYKQKKEILLRLFEEKYYQKIMKVKKNVFRNGFIDGLIIVLFENKMFGTIIMLYDVYRFVTGICK